MDSEITNNIYCGPWAPAKMKTKNKNKTKRKQKKKKVGNKKAIKRLECIDSAVSDIGPCDSSVCDNEVSPQQNDDFAISTSSSNSNERNMHKKNYIFPNGRDLSTELCEFSDVDVAVNLSANDSQENACEGKKSMRANKSTKNKNETKVKQKKKNVGDTIVAKPIKPIDSGVTDVGPCDSSMCDYDESLTKNVASCDNLEISFGSCDSTEFLGIDLSLPLSPQKIVENNETNVSSSIENELNESDMPLSALARKLQGKNNSPAEEDENGSASNSNKVSALLFGPQRSLNHEVSYEIMPGFRYSSSLLFCPDEQQFYVRNTSSKVGTGYTCYVKECLCRMHVRDGKCYIGNTFSHDHSDQTEMYYNLSALNEMKRILRSIDNRRTPKEVFDDVMSR